MYVCVFSFVRLVVINRIMALLLRLAVLMTGMAIHAAEFDERLCQKPRYTGGQMSKITSLMQDWKPTDNKSAFSQPSDEQNLFLKSLGSANSTVRLSL